jgi:hypothetical protein
LRHPPHSGLEAAKIFCYNGKIRQPGVKMAAFWESPSGGFNGQDKKVYAQADGQRPFLDIRHLFFHGGFHSSFRKIQPLLR